MDLSKLLARAHVLVTSFVTYAAVLAAVLVLAAEQISQAAPEGSEGVTRWLLIFAGVLGEIVTIVRTRIPAPAPARGLLMPDGVELTVDVEVTGDTS